MWRTRGTDGHLTIVGPTSTGWKESWSHAIIAEPYAALHVECARAAPILYALPNICGAEIVNSLDGPIGPRRIVQGFCRHRVNSKTVVRPAAWKLSHKNAAASTRWPGSAQPSLPNRAIVAIAPAGGGFQPASIDDRDVASRITYQSTLLQCARGFGDPFATYTEHAG